MAICDVCGASSGTACNQRRASIAARTAPNKQAKRALPTDLREGARPAAGPGLRLPSEVGSIRVRVVDLHRVAAGLGAPFGVAARRAWRQMLGRAHVRLLIAARAVIAGPQTSLPAATGSAARASCLRRRC